MCTLLHRVLTIGTQSDATKICDTAALLLGTVANSDLLVYMICDLIYLSKDLAVLSESGLLVRGESVQVLLFEETVEKASDGNGATPEFILTIPNVEALCALQGAVLTVLERLVALRKERRLHRADAAIVVEDLDERYLTNGNDDLYYFLLEAEDVRALLASLRQALLADTGSLKQVAVRVLLQLVADWRRTGAEHLATVQEAALLVARAAVVALKTVPTSDAGLYTGLGKLVSTTIHNPPGVQGSVANAAAAIHKVSFAVLYDSVRFMASGGSSNECRCHLEVVVLRTIHAMMRSLCQHDSAGRPSVSFAVVSTHDIVGHFFRLLSDRVLSDSAVLILSNLLNFRPTDLENAAKYGLEAIDPDESPDDDGRPDPTTYGNSFTTAGAKRKVSSSPLGDNPGDSSTLPSVCTAKRHKVDRAVDSSALRVDVFSSFLCVALRSSSKLCTLLRRDVEISCVEDPRLSDSILVDLVNVSSAVRLILAMVRVETWGCSASTPNLSRVTETFLETLSAVTGALLLLSTTDPQTRIIGEVAVSCGVFAEQSIGLLTCDLAQGRVFSKVVSFIKLALLLAEHVGMLSDLSHESSSRHFSTIPKALHETLHGLTQNRGSGGSTGLLPLICGFGDQQVSVVISSTNTGCLSAVCAGPVLASISGDMDMQTNRLNTLFTKFGRKIGTVVAIEQQSLEMSKLADKAHPDRLVRLLMWKSLAWMVASIDPSDLRRLFRDDNTENDSNPDFICGGQIVHYLIDVAFADPDPVVRDYSSRELGGILSANSWTSLLALLSTDKEWQQLGGIGTCLRRAAAARRAAEEITSRLFQRVDGILYELCSVPQSQLSFTMASAPRQSGPPTHDTSHNTAVFFRRSAARALCSMFVDANSYTECGRIVVEHAIIRVIRMWSGIDRSLRFEGGGVCFAELWRLNHCSRIGPLLREKYLATFAPALFRDVLVPSSSILTGPATERIERMSHGLRERQFDLLSTFIRLILLGAWSSSDISDFSLYGESDLERCLDSCLPYVISQLVVEKDHGALQMTAGYKLYILGQKRSDDKNRTRSGTSYLQNEPGSGLIVGDRVRPSSSRLWTRRLEDQTRQLCLAPGLIERIIPQVFMRAGRDELIFFTKNVLQNKFSLKELVASREMLTLKNFAIELGRNPEMAGSVIRAMTAAALARNQESSSTSRIAVSSELGNVDDEAVSAWVTSHFMYLLVNVAQHKWSTKSNDHRIEALRSLLSLLDFLRPSEASQYLPQIMATVNAAIADEEDSAENRLNPTPRSHLRLIAVQALAKFVKLVAETQWEVLSQNLTSVVVCLVPVLSDGDGGEESCDVESDCCSHAVALLEWLTQGELGTKLSPYFAEIPFLPPSSSLDLVRASLRSRGVNFDNLQVVSTQGTQDIAPRSTASDAGSTSGDSRGVASHAARQAALRRRLETICPLLENESGSVRRVVLQHLTALLRANRELFHGLVENEGTASLKRFITVAHRGKSGTFCIHSVIRRSLKLTYP